MRFKRTPILLSGLLAFHLPLFAEDFQADVKLMTGPRVSVTAADLARELARAPDEAQAKIKEDPASLRRMVESIYIRREAAAQAELQFGSRPDVVSELALLRERTLTDILLAETVKKALTTEANALAYARTMYRAEPEKFMSPQQFRVRQIYFPVLSADDACSVKAKAADILDKIRAGADFVAFAAQFANGLDSSLQGGDLGFIAMGQQDAAFDAALGNLKTVGQLSNLVISESSIRILRLEEIRPPKPRAFDEVKEGLIKLAQNQASSQARTKVLKEILDAASGNAEAIESFAQNAKKMIAK